MRDINIQSKLLDLSKRASKIKSDPQLRHTPNEHDLSTASENARLMQIYQYKTISTEYAPSHTLY